MEFFAAILVILGGATLFFAALAISTLLNGWALSLLWAWFIVPVFSLPALSVGQAIGISMIVSFLTYHPYRGAKDKDKSDAQEAFEVISWVILRPLITLLIGLLVKQFI